MADTGVRTGTVQIYINGVLFESMKDAKVTGLALLEREAVVGDQPYGFTRSPRAGEVECKFAHGPALSIESIMAIENGECQFNCDSGPVFVLTRLFAMSADFSQGKPTTVDCKLGFLGSEETGVTV